MKVFQFRLQKVLNYRETMERWAQEAYLDTRVARLEAEAAVLEVDARRQAALGQTPASLDDHKALETRLLRFDDEERERQMVAEILQAEEEKALAAWNEKKQELEAMVKLRDKAHEEWRSEANRAEQAELDEWSVMRRRGA